MLKDNKFTEGKLYSYSSKIYVNLIYQLCFLITITPAIFGLLFLDRSFQNILLWAIYGLCIGPSFSALAASYQYCGDEISPFILFFKKYKKNFRQSMKLMMIFTCLTVIFLVDVQYFSVKNLDLMKIPFFIALIALFLLTILSFVIQSVFEFRIRDLYRLSVYYFTMNFKVLIKLFGACSIMIIIMDLTTDLILILGTGILVKYIVGIFLPILFDIKKNFIKDDTMNDKEEKEQLDEELAKDFQKLDEERNTKRKSKRKESKIPSKELAFLNENELSEFQEEDGFL